MSETGELQDCHPVRNLIFERKYHTVSSEELSSNIRDIRDVLESAEKELHRRHALMTIRHVEELEIFEVINSHNPFCLHKYDQYHEGPCQFQKNDIDDPTPPLYN